MLATQLPSNVFEHIQINAGIILDSFDTSSWAVSLSNIIGATSGGINFTDTPTYEDLGADIDNCPKNTKELKRLVDRVVQLSGTFVSITPEQVKMLASASDLNTKKITPRNDLILEDFKDLWFVGDYGNEGAIAIHLMNGLSESGFQLQTGDKTKGTFPFAFVGHYSINNIDTVPYEVYFK